MGILVPLLLLAALVVIAMIPGGAYGPGAAAETVARLVSDVLSSIF
jgi:hypothetical protein